MAYLHILKHYDPENAFPKVDGQKGSSTVSLWFNSCSKKCDLCWNPETWGRKRSLYRENSEVVTETLAALDEFFPKNLALLGGDPLENSFEDQLRNNAADTLEILTEIKKARPHTKVICWTGYAWDECIDDPLIKKILDKGLIDILVDGRFEIENKIEGKIYGSSNQRAIDVAKTLKNNQITTIDG